MHRYKAVLACKRFKRKHSNESIAKILEEVFSAYELNNTKVLSTVTDNASNFKKAFKVFGNIKPVNSGK